MPTTIQVELADLRRGEAAAWRRVHRWVQQAAASFRSVLAEEWDDAVQEAEIKLLRALQSRRLGDTTNVGALARRIARNACVDQLRRRRVRSSSSIDEVTEPRAPRVDSPSHASEQNELRAQVSRLLQLVPDECRTLLGMIEQGQSYSEMADRLGVSPGAVRVRVHRCRQRTRLRFARMTSPIVVAAQRLFIERGYAATPLSDIAEAAGVTEAEVIELFEDKSALLVAMGHRIITGADGVLLEESDLARPLRATDDPFERVDLATQVTSKMFARGIPAFEAVVFEAAGDGRNRSVLKAMFAMRVGIGRILVGGILDGQPLPRDQSLESLSRAALEIDSVANYLRLEQERRWSPEEIRRWKQRKLERMLFG